MSIPWRISRLVFAEMANAKALAKVLKPFAAEHGLSFVKYDEAEKCKDAKTLPAELKQHKGICSAILQLPKTASKSTIKDALEEIYEDFKSTWKLDAKTKDDWLVTMTRRLANMQHILQNAKGKATKPKWFLEVVGGAEAEVVGEDKAEVQYDYGFDNHAKIAHRIMVGKGFAKEIASKVDSDRADHEPILAHFGDGTSKEIPEVTCKAYRDLKKHDAGSGILWRGEHSRTSNMLRVQIRTDRGTLISLFEQGHQVCQVALDAFESAAWKQENRQGSYPDKFKVANTKEATTAGEKLMIGVAEAYAADSIAKEQLYDHRDSLLRAAGLQKGTKRKETSSTSAAEKSSTPKAKSKAKAKAKADGYPNAKAKGEARGKSTVQPSPKASPIAEPDDPEESAGSESEVVDTVIDSEAEAETQIQRKPAARTPAASQAAGSSEVKMPALDLTSIEDQIPR